MELARQLLGVGCVLALLWALVWVQRKKGVLPGSSRSKGNRVLELVERMPLTPHHSVHLLRVGDRNLLLGVHSAGFTLLSDDRHPGTAKS